MKPVTDRGPCMLCGQPFKAHEAFKGVWYCMDDNGNGLGPRYAPKVSDSELEAGGQLRLDP